jgi:hypothetical protein
MGVKISGLTAKGATIADTDLVEVSQSAGGGTYVSRSVTGANIKALVTDANLTTTDVTTNNVSTSKHGFAPKAPNDGTKFLDGLGAYDTVKDSDLSLSDITTNDVSTTKHGFVPKAPNDTTKFLRGDGTWQVPAAGGLTKFTEAENTSAPNGTVYVDSLTAAASSTNADFAIIPKGTGALIANIPDNGVTGGSKRGQYAVDWQRTRGAFDRVASGDYSAIIGGYNNIANSTGGIAGGTNAVASNGHSISLGATNTAGGGASIAMGSGNGATQQNSIALGSNNTSSGQYSFVVGVNGIASAIFSTSIGNENLASGGSSFAHGTYSNAFSIYGRKCYASGRESTTGDAQASKFILRERTTGNTATTLTTDSDTAGTTNQVILSNNSAYRFKGTIIGKKSGTTDIAAWDVDGLIVRGANAASTTLAVSNVTLIQNTPAWGTPTLTADTGNGGLKIQVTGAATTNIQWTCTIDTTEVLYA